MLVRSLKIAAAVIALAATTASAQKVVSTKMGGGGSPHETVEWTVQGAKITISYGRPYLKARPVESLTPAGKIWRTGADEATTLTTDHGLMFGSLMIPAGTYTLYTVPGPTSWKLVVSKQTGQWGTEYREGQDLGRTPMAASTLAAPSEQLTVAVVGSNLEIHWGTMKQSVAISAKK